MTPEELHALVVKAITGEQTPVAQAWAAISVVQKYAPLLGESAFHEENRRLLAAGGSIEMSFGEDGWTARTFRFPPGWESPG